MTMALGSILANRAELSAISSALMQVVWDSLARTWEELGYVGEHAGPAN